MQKLLLLIACHNLVYMGTLSVSATDNPMITSAEKNILGQNVKIAKTPND